MADVKLLLLHRNTWNHLTVCKKKKKKKRFQVCLKMLSTKYVYKPSSGIVCMCKECFVFRFFIILQTYVNTKLDKTKMPMTSNKFKTLFTHANNPWWWPMKGLKALKTTLVNSSINSNLKPRHLSGNLKES